MARIGALLGDAREDAGLPQSAVAKALGVPQSRIAKLELGRRQLLFAEAALLADLYGVSTTHFDPRTNEPRPRARRRRRVDLPKSPRAG
jgi:transcriptional regulator with XRE-family HTH domain